MGIGASLLLFNAGRIVFGVIKTIIKKSIEFHNFKKKFKDDLNLKKWLNKNKKLAKDYTKDTIAQGSY